MSAAPSASPDNIEMSSILSALKNSARRLLVTSTVIALLTYGVLSLIAPRYQSEAELAIVARGAAGGFSDQRSTAGPETVTTKMDREAINTHVRALQSADLLSRIAEETKLVEKREFNPALGPADMLDQGLRLLGFGGPRAGESDRDRVLSALRERLQVYAARESRFIGIRVTSSNPELAADLANRLADNYRQSLANQGISEIDDQQDVLEAKIERLMPEVLELETEVERYRGEINAFKGGAQNTGLNEQQLSELTAELTRANAARGEAQARARSAREMMKLGTADALPDVQKSPLIQNLVEQRVRIERQISELSASLLPGHPRMRQLQADLAGLKLQLNGEVSKLVDSLSKEAKVAEGREESIKASLAELKSKVVSNAPEEAKLRQLEANAKAKRNELENLQAQIEANRKKLDTRAQPVEAQLISKAQPASVPVFPKKGSMSALAFVAALLLGTAWTVTRALFVSARSPAPAAVALSGSRPLRPEPSLAADQAGGRRATDRGALPASDPTPASVPGPLAGPVVASLPKAEATSAKETSISGLAERIAARRTESGGHRTLMTGATALIEPGEEAIALVSALSAMGRQVMLVDWSPNGGGLAGRLGVAAVPGLTDLLFGEASFEQAVSRVSGTAAHVIAGGTPLSETSGDLDPDQLNLVLDALDEAYDHIVVTGAHDDARALFEAIQGRFDAAVTVREAVNRVRVIDDPSGTFLGFEVTEMDVIDFERPARPVNVTQQRLLRATQRPGGAALPN